MSASRALGLMIVASWLTAGCSSPMKINVGGTCVLNSDCNQGLVCTWGKCHVACNTSADCPAGQSCVTSSDQSNVCQLPGETYCIYNHDCPTGLICGVDQQCRKQCQVDVDCLYGQICTSAQTCVDPNNNPVMPDGGVSGTGGASGAGGSGGGAGSSGSSDAGVPDVPGAQPDVPIGSAGGTSAAGTAITGGSIATGGSTSAGGAGGIGGASGVASPSPMDASTLTSAGNPNGSCSTGVPARGQPADTSNPTTVVGTGTEASCSFAQLQVAATTGGVITFNCGSAPVSILVTATLNLPTTKNTVIDGGNKITLDGGNAVQILRFDSANFQANTNGLTLQHITLVNGKTTPTQAIPTAPAPCSQGWDDGEGGALYMGDGYLTVIDSIFTNNQAAPLGPDTGGGAIYVLGSKNGVLIVGSTFSNNAASNAGAVGCLFSELDVYNSLFTNNTATGNGANNDDAGKCSVINNGQNEVGSGGNGGALYSDGNSVNVTLCGDAILNNSAGQNAFGGGLYFTSDDMGGTLSIADTTMTGNTGGHWTVVSSGSVTNVGTAVGTNAKSITVTNSTLQGYP